MIATFDFTLVGGVRRLRMQIHVLGPVFWKLAGRVLLAMFPLVP
jgi:hypothetical protein